jgi:hypothetical protein
MPGIASSATVVLDILLQEQKKTIRVGSGGNASQSCATCRIEQLGL